MREKSNERLGSAVGLAVFAAVLWGVSGAVAVDAFEEVAPTRVAQVRSLVALAFLLPYAWRRGLLRTHGTGRQLVGFGLILATVHVTYYWALERLGVGPGVTVQFLGPILVLVWMTTVQKRPVPRPIWLAGLAALAGTVMVTRAWDFAALDLLGVGAGLASAITFGAYLLTGEHLTRRLSPVTLLTYGFLVAALFWLVAQPLWDFPTNLSPKAWIELLWVGVGGNPDPVPGHHGRAETGLGRNRRGGRFGRTGCCGGRRLVAPGPIAGGRPDRRRVAGRRGRRRRPTVGRA